MLHIGVGFQRLLQPRRQHLGYHVPIEVVVAGHEKEPIGCESERRENGVEQVRPRRFELLGLTAESRIAAEDDEIDCFE